MNLKKIAPLFHPNRILFKGAFFIFTTVAVLLLIVHLFLQHFFSVEKIQSVIDNFAAENNFELVYDLEISHSWFVTPYINLKNVRLRENKINRTPFLVAKEIKIKMAYIFLLGKLDISELVINQADFLFYKKTNENWKLFNFPSLKSSPIHQQIALKKLHINDSNFFFYQEMIDNVSLFKQTQISWNGIKNNQLQLASQFYHGKHNLGQVNLSANTALNQQKLYLDNTQINFHADHHYFGDSELNINIKELFFDEKGIDGNTTEISGKSAKVTILLQLEKWHYFADDLNIIKASGTFILPQEKDWNGHYEFATLDYRPNALKLEKAKIDMKKQTVDHIFLLKAQGDLDYVQAQNIFNVDNIIINSEQINKYRNRSIFSAILQGKIQSQPQKNLDFILNGDINQRNLTIDGNYNNKTKTWTSNVNLSALDLKLVNEITLTFSNIINLFIKNTDFVLANLGDKTFKSKIKIGEVRSDIFESSKFSMNILAKNNKITFNDIVASIYGGESTAQLVVYKKEKLYAKMEHELKNIKIGPWLRDWLGINNLTGVGDSQLQLSANGNNLNDFKHSLSGKTIIRLADGSINGLDIPYLLENIQEINSLENFKRQFPFDINKKTPFKVFSAQTVWKNGIGNTLATTMYGKNFYLSGQGQINLPENKLDYLLSIYYDVIIAGRSKEIVLPLRINGELDQPVYTLDYQSIVQGSQSEEEKQQALREFIYKRWSALP